MDADFEKGLIDITSSSSRFTSEISSYILSSGGKRLRPKLVIMMGEAVGLDKKLIMPMAYSVEILHTASLLHDDVVDGTEIRRSKPTANQVYGDKPSLLTGDYLSATAMDIVFSLGNIKLAQLIAGTIKKMSEGELREIEHSESFHDNMNIYLDIIYLKTASLFELCTCAPGLIKGLDDDKIKALSSFGRNVGMAFQIVDDVINVYPLKDDDKDAYNDISERKSTLPMINLFKEKPELLLRLSSTESIDSWRDILVPHFTREILINCRKTAKEHLDMAMSSLIQTGINSEKMLNLPETVLIPLEKRLNN